MLKLSTVIFSWRLYLRDGSYVKKQNMLVIFFNVFSPSDENDEFMIIKSTGLDKVLFSLTWRHFLPCT